MKKIHRLESSSSKRPHYKQIHPAQTIRKRGLSESKRANSQNFSLLQTATASSSAAGKPSLMCEETCSRAALRVRRRNTGAFCHHLEHAKSEADLHRLWRWSWRSRRWRKSPCTATSFHLRARMQANVFTGRCSDLRLHARASDPSFYSLTPNVRLTYWLSFGGAIG